MLNVLHTTKELKAKCDLVDYVPLCVGRSKGKAGMHLKYYPENRDTFEMYPGKVMHIIGR